MSPGQMLTVLEEKYQEELKAYLELMTLAGRVKEELSEGREAEIEPLLAEQARLSTAVDRCEEIIAPLRRAAAVSFGCSELTLAVVTRKAQEGSASLRPLARTMGEVARVLQELANLYADNQRVLEVRLSSVRAEQIELGRAKNAVQAYQSPVGDTAAPRFLDKRS